MSKGLPALFVGLRAGDPELRLIAGSIARPCAECGAETMFSPSLYKRARQHEAVRWVCLDCAVDKELMAGMVLEAPNETQRAELAANGIDPEDWPLKELWGQQVPKRGKP